MMLNKLLDQLRPRTDSPADLTTALHEAEAALAKQRDRLALLEARRGEALLTGGETARRHEAALRDARDEVERLEALAAALRAKHAEAERQERRAALERQVDEARQKAEDAGRAIDKRYPQLAAELIALVEAEREAMRAVMDAAMALNAAGELGQGITPPAEPMSIYSTQGTELRLPLADALILPDHRRGAGAPPLWPRLIG
jgi:flagellar biosynthesis/type III secretory pathway protein FliH